MKATLGLLCLLVAVPAYAQTPTVFITPTKQGFEVYLAAALALRWPRAFARFEVATYTLKASEIDVSKENTGSKFARCLFAYCAGIEDKGAVSVQLIEDNVIRWSYSVNKGRGSQKNKQALTEAVAKHLKHEYFRQQN